LTPQIQNLLTLLVWVYLSGVALTLVDLGLGVRLLGLGTVLLAGWLLRYDIARRTVRQTGLPRYIAVCLLAGYGWLGFGGLLAIWKGAIYVGADYAAVLHAFLLGFVFSMIFGHAPIILPALTGIRLNYMPLFYIHLAVLHLTVLYRMFSYLGGSFPAQQWSGLLNVVAVLLFLAVTLLTLLRAKVTG
jgi:hypothetical protein